ncbi:MAG: hypothetical protein HUU15_14630, partial [Candidatus Brocadiae bacterium]|nr:hypothetical protein [Candidatus Brocadiia bacterium]
PRLRGAAVAGILIAGAAVVPLAAPPATASVESFAIEVARGRNWDRFEATAVTAPVAGPLAYAQEGPAEPEPAFFSPRDAGERVVEVARTGDGFEVRPGFMAARSTVCTVRRSSRAGAGRLSVTDGRALNETDRDLREAAIVDSGSVAWIGDLPAGSERAADGAARLSDLRSRLGRTARRRMFDLWWRRADHDRAWLVGFADELPPQDAPAAARTGHGVLVVLPLR